MDPERIFLVNYPNGRSFYPNREGVLWVVMEDLCTFAPNIYDYYHETPLVSVFPAYGIGR